MDKAMNRPLLLQLLPERLRLSAWYKIYAHRVAHEPHRYEAAPLAYAPQVRLKLLPSDHISSQIAYTGFYELPLTRRIVELSKRGGTMIDIGANMGYFSCLWAAGRPDNHCIAFEASPIPLKYLRHNIAHNGLDKQITLFSLAAGAEAGILNFAVGPETQTGWGGFTLADNPNSIEVEVVRVDQVLTGERSIDLLKIDIEGADTWALLGCQTMLGKKQIKEIFYEQNKPRMQALGIDLDQAQIFLESLGYLCTPQNDPTHKLVEWRATLPD
ncbi:FkbM family methyltransferase [Nodosilinea sp. AN01ver1]|uniref:FkbM family methyltransferase n=1 Tax=Nodosilinea sp. AN01ver1 TaxID=3423362 RepID=UPI003D31C8CE